MRRETANVLQFTKEVMKWINEAVRTKVGKFEKCGAF